MSCNLLWTALFIHQCSSVVEQRTHIPYVASSSLAIGTRDWYRDCALAFQAKETSLNLVSRSRDLVLSQASALEDIA